MVGGGNGREKRAESSAGEKKWWVVSVVKGEGREGRKEGEGESEGESKTALLKNRTGEEHSTSCSLTHHPVDGHLLCTWASTCFALLCMQVHM